MDYYSSMTQKKLKIHQDICLGYSTVTATQTPRAGASEPTSFSGDITTIRVGTNANTSLPEKIARSLASKWGGRGHGRTVES